MPSRRPLFSAPGSLKYMSAEPCSTNQCFCHSPPGLDFISHPFLQFNSSWGEGTGMVGTTVVLVSSLVGRLSPNLVGEGVVGG